MSDSKMRYACCCNDTEVCAGCQEQLAFARQRMLLLECLEKTEELRSDFASKGVTQAELDERVEDEFESAFERHLARAADNGDVITDEGLKEFEREFERGIKDTLDEMLEEGDYQSEREVDSLIEDALESKNYQSEQDVLEMIRLERREIDAAIDDLHSRMTAFAAEQPIGFWQRMRWLFTGVAHKKRVQ